MPELSSKGSAGENDVPETLRVSKSTRFIRSGLSCMYALYVQ